ncbi:pullulanase [Thalassococcus profundi]|jgi:putative photosynthetic complex assembly protein|uniref:Pullulanase n=1 Tax=Thalassococcus profundi TaxID=2282382 RepID=A0A369TZ30_9RHOB|nr:photosynthetic complex assembly protein PuhC [Thalassococcus profundi]RDD68226.1 pullulanase [Thalassococcus profundi]
MTQTATPRIHATPRDLVPRRMVRAMFGLVALCLVLVSIAVWSGRPVTSVPPDSEVVRERFVYLSGDLAGAAMVLDATGSVIADLSPEQGGFIAGIARVLDRERTKARQPLDGPVRIVRTANGRLAIFDPSTGWRADLMGFGADNAAAFARLLD